jgi:hypothetical protein
VAHEPFSEVATEIFFLSFLHKSTHWAHEREARIFHIQHAFKKLSFDPQELIGFILGAHAPPELERKMRDEIKNRRPSVSVDSAVLSPTEFRIIIPHKFLREHVSPA